MRRTKIIATMGPACSDERIFTEMCLKGLNVVRFNFSHGSHKDYEKKMAMVKSVREKLGLPIAVLLDTKGPEYRIGTFKKGFADIKKGEEFSFTTDDIKGTDTRVSVSCKGMIQQLSEGDIILLNNGLIRFRVKKLTDTDAVCIALDEGRLSDKKSMAFPGKVLNQAYLSEQDKADILFGVKSGVDFIACSFVSRAQDMIDVKSFLSENDISGVELIAKIENRSGVDNIEEIMAECDGIMVARGDLGVEIPYEELPAIQKHLITKCRLMGKRVITATEMLESMITNPRPTRAEISDVANAVYDGSSAIMLSGETAAGKHPVEAVEIMSKIAECTEENIHYKKRFASTSFIIKNTVDAISHATCSMSIDIGARAISVCTISGLTARMVSRFRPPVSIVGITTDKRTWRKLALSWGVIPVMCEELPSSDVLFYTAKKLTGSVLKLKQGDKIVITGGTVNGKSGNTNLIKIESV